VLRDLADNVVIILQASKSRSDGGTQRRFDHRGAGQTLTDAE